jgi:hypothetical protein
MAGSKVGTAWYELRADDAPLRAAVTQAEGAIKASGTRAATSFTSAFSTGAGKIKSILTSQVGGVIAGLGAAFAATKIIGFFGDAIGAASDLGETISKVGVIFGREFTPELEEWAEGAAQAFGQSKEQALSAAATFATFGKSAGLAGQDLVTFSTDLVELAGDLASFHNATPEEVIEALGAALRGEAEPMRRFGVLLDDATLRNKAFEMGIISTTRNALTPQQKVLAAQAVIMEQTADAQGDFERTSDGLANQQRILSAELANVTADIGQGLLPVMLTLARFANDTLVPALRGIVDSFSDTEEGIGGFITDVGRGLRNLDLMFGENGEAIRKWAFDNGHSVDEAMRIVANGMDELNLTWEEATERAKQILSGTPTALTDATRNAITDWKQADLGSMVAEDIAGAASEIEAGVEQGITQPTQDELERNRQLAEEAARAMTADYADEIAGGADAVTQAWEDLLQGAEDEMSETARIADIEAKLASPALRNALESEDPYLRAQAVATRDTLLNELDLLTTGAIDRAVRTGESLPDALKAQQTNAALQAGILASRAVNALGTAPPEAARHGASTGAGYTGGVGAYSGTAYTKGWTVGSQSTTGMKHGAGGARSGGYSIGDAWMNGITSAIWAANPELVTALNYMKRQMGGSLPEIGPLAGKTAQHGGESVGDAWAGGAVSRLWVGARQINQALKSIALTPRGTPLRVDPIGPVGPFAPRLGLPHLAGGTTASFGNIVVNIDRFSGSAEEIESVSQRLANSIRLRARSAF